MGFPKLLIEDRTRRIEELQMNVQKELNCVNRKLNIAIRRISNPYGHPNILAEFICKIFRIKEPIAKGLALGSAAHAIGTAKAMEMGEIEGAMSSLSIAVAGILTVALSSVFAGFM